MFVARETEESREMHSKLSHTKATYKLNLVLLNYQVYNLAFKSRQLQVRTGMYYSTDITTKLKDVELHENHKKLLHSVNAKSTKP